MTLDSVSGEFTDGSDEVIGGTLEHHCSCAASVWKTSHFATCNALLTKSPLGNLLARPDARRSPRVAAALTRAQSLGIRNGLTALAGLARKVCALGHHRANSRAAPPAESWVYLPSTRS